MRIVRHPNIVHLKAFYYSNGERVRISRNLIHHGIEILTRCVERRSLSESCARVRA